MDDNENKLKEALDDIFGTDFIDIDNSQNTINESDNSFDDVLASVKDSLKSNDSSDTNDEVTSNITKEELEDNIVANEPRETEVESNIDNPIDDNKTETPVFIEETNDDNSSKVNYDAIDNDVTDSLPNKKGNGMLAIIIVIVALLITAFVIYILSINNKEMKEYCFYEANDTGYKITDSYLIQYKGDKIIYVEGTYEYKALNDEYKSQIDAIKEEKMPVILNSYGLNGFTHTYELSSDSIKINSYYDVELFDSNIVDKNDDKSNPLSYIDIKTNTKYKDLKKSLESKGYMCSISK